MESLLFGLVAGSGLTWVSLSLRRDGYWREFNARRRGSNPPPPGRKPTPQAGPPDWSRSFNHATNLIRIKEETTYGECTNPPTGAPPLKLRRKEAPRILFVEGNVQRGNGNGGPTTPKPPTLPHCLP
jgi:hypothetical protein